MSQNTPPAKKGDQPRFGAHFGPLDYMLLIVGWYGTAQMLLMTREAREMIETATPVTYVLIMLVLWTVYRFSKAWLFNLKPSLFGPMKS